MKIPNKFLIALSVIFIVSNTILGILGVKEFAVYFTIDACIFILAALSFNFSLTAMARLRALGAILFIGFLMIIVFKIYRMI